MHYTLHVAMVNLSSELESIEKKLFEKINTEIFEMGIFEMGDKKLDENEALKEDLETGNRFWMGQTLCCCAKDHKVPDYEETA